MTPVIDTQLHSSASGQAPGALPFAAALRLACVLVLALSLNAHAFSMALESPAPAHETVQSALAMHDGLPGPIHGDFGAHGGEIHEIEELEEFDDDRLDAAHGFRLRADAGQGSAAVRLRSPPHLDVPFVPI